MKDLKKKGGSVRVVGIEQTFFLILNFPFISLLMLYTTEKSRSTRRNASSNKLRKRRKTRFTPRVESLEQRKLLAAAILEGDTLTLTGSGDSNQIEVSSLAPGLVQINVGEGDVIQLSEADQASGNLILSADRTSLQVRTATTSTGLSVSNRSSAEGEFISNAFGLSDPITRITLIGGDGDDILSAFGVTESVLIIGGGGNDTLTGGDGDDLIDGGDGDDIIIGGLGDDNLVGGNGNDTIFGGDGDDRLVGGSGADDLTGGDGDDRVIGDGQIEVTVTNLQTENGSLLTPVFLATQNGVYDIFDLNAPASPSLESLAEDGTTGPRIAAALASGGVGEALATPGGPLLPGESRTITFFADPSDDLTRYLSYLSMVIPSNDAFVGNDDPEALDLFDGNELIRRVGPTAFIVNGDEVFDAGTEVNDEIPENTAALAQTAPNTGVTENGVIVQHPGFQGSQRLGGDIGNVLNAIPAGDFTVPGAQILSIEVDDARQELGFDLATPTASFQSRSTLQTVPELLDQAVAGNLYYNIHTVNVASGEIRGQLELVSDETINGIRTIELAALLDSSQEPNDTSDSDATGSGRVTIVTDGVTTTYTSTLSVEGITIDELMPVAGFSAIHIHNAPAGTNGPVILDIVQDAGGDITGTTADGAGSVFDVTFESNDDILRGGRGNDFLVGGIGDDVLIGGGGSDTLVGGEGNDTNSFEDIGLGVVATVNADGTGTASYGGVSETFTGIENLTGSAQNDVLTATGAASNILIGGAGDDVLLGGGGTDFIDGGEGNDTNSFANIGLGVTATINDDGTGVAFYGSVSESFAGIENLVGSANDDVLTGNSLNNQIDGGAGDDILVGGDGDDILFGSDGDDQLQGNGGDDRLVGGNGEDNLSGGTGDDRLIGGGQITVTLTNLQTDAGALLTPIVVATQNGIYDQIDIGSPASENIERLAEDGTTGPRIAAALASGGVGQAQATAGGPLGPGEVRTLTFFADPSDPLTQYLSWASMVIPSNDAFIANDSPLELDLFNGTSLIRRTGENAFIIRGSDVLDAGTEVNDEIPENTAALAQTSPNTGVTEGGVIRTHEGFQGSLAFGGPIGNVLTARPNADFTLPDAQILSIEVDASADGADVLAGGEGNDLLSGGEGDDVLIGGSGNDELIGGNGDDRLVGGFGSDELDGGLGDDHLLGGGQIEVTVTNLQADDGALLTPVFLATQDGVYDFFDIGGFASPSLELLAEDGITSSRIDAAFNSGGVGDALATDGGVIAPGQSRVVTLFADPSEPLTQFLSFASMVIPSNDAFVGNDDPLAIDLFDGDSLIQRIGADAFIVTGDEVYDAGTEVNDEIPENTAGLAQTAPNTGVTQNAPISQHDGLQGSARLGGPIGNVLAARSAADFTLPGAEILSIEVDGIAGEVFTISNEFSPLASLSTDQTPQELVTEAIAGNLYYNIHTVNVGSGEIRGQLFLTSDTTDADGVRTIVLDASLDSSQEPNDTSDSDATGTGRLTIVDDGVNLTYSSELEVTGIRVDELMPVAGFSAIHIHNAPAGTNGPVILDIVQDAGGDIFGNSDEGSVFDEVLDDDILIGGGGNDVLSGGAGNDLLAGGGGFDTIIGGEGFDTNSFQGIGLGVTATLNSDGTGTASYGSIAETFTGIESLIGSDNDDTLTGTPGDDILEGGAGNDTIIGLGGNDILIGNEGDDQIRGDGGDDLIEGGPGNDILLGGTGSDEVFGNSGNDRLVGGGGLDRLDGGTGDDAINVLPDLTTLTMLNGGSFDGSFTVPSSINTTGISFLATENTRLTLSGFDSTSGFVITDSALGQISLLQDGSQVADLVAGESYVLLFEPSANDRLFSLDSSAGPQAIELGIGNLVNATSTRDVSADGQVTSLDALLVINSLGRLVATGPRALAVSQQGRPLFVDVNGDQEVSALDALLVINQLSQQSGSGGNAEGEFIAGTALDILQTFSTGSVDLRDEILNGNDPQTFEQPTKLVGGGSGGESQSTGGNAFDGFSLSDDSSSEQEDLDEASSLTDAIDSVFAELGAL